MSGLELCEHLQECIEENPFLEAEWPVNNFSSFDNSQFLENIAEKNTFHDEIYSQMLFLKLNDKEKEIAQILLDGINENGYLNNDLLKYVSREKDIPYFEILPLIKKLQQVSPSGLFSFNLKDKIRITLEAHNKYNRNHGILIENLENISKHGLLYLKNKCGFNDEQLSQMISEINNIGINFNTNAESNDFIYEVPDLIIEIKAKDDLELCINDEARPQISANKCLYEKTIANRCSQNDKKYANDKFSSAELLIKSLNYRNSTLLKIMREIAHHQQDFLEGKSDHMYPLSVKSIASSLIMHESTAHRAISEKTVVTPRGTFDIKALLPKEVKTTDCENVVSDYSIKEYMKTLINNEPKDNPYSDDHIVSCLNSRGINISRRTVSKYRNAMEIPTSHQRTRLHKILMAK
ncbi:RNA polymerase sigma-54 factor [Alphaproteobacteria bacterium]|nr:RNA polymerase sigma-54 factor [Alphaproteobacteria bacterium]